MRTAAAIFFLISGFMAYQAAFAEQELVTPDGRRVLLRDNGTWAYIETMPKDTQGAKPTETKAKDAPATEAAAKDTKGKDGKAREAKNDKKDGELLLRVDNKTEFGTACRFDLQLVNKMPYEVTSLVLSFSAYRPDGVLYATETAGSQFGSLKPGNAQRRQLEFRGITCKEIARLQVSGGDRCTMGDLHRWSDIAEVKGECLARVKVVESNLVRFDK
jgi:hypothetical protein